MLADLAVAVCRLARGDEAGARAVLDRQPEPAGQPVRSDLWRASLQTALGAGDDWADQAARLRSFELAVQAGRAAAEHRRGGPPVGDQHRPYLPPVWCAPRPATVRIQLLGGAAIELDRRPVDAPAWRRQRVREQALHLAVRSDVGRHAVAAALWPELDEAGGARNPRVNLTHLLDLLDPDRPRGKGSDLVEVAAGVLRFSSDPRLFVDLREQDDAVSAILEAAIGSEGTVAVLAAADRLLGLPSGPVLGGSPVGEWFEPVGRRLEERLLRSAVLAGERAIGVGDGDLARELAERMLSVDPWAEQAHRLKIAAALARGEPGGARRAVRQTFEALGELGVQPEPATLALARRGRLAVR